MTEQTQAALLFAEVALHALAREEVMGRKGQRLLEPQRMSWERFRGRLGSAALASLLVEDGAVTHPAAFDAPTLLGASEPLAPLADAQVDTLLAGLTEASVSGAGADYLQAQAQRLGISHRFARSNLPRGIKAHHRVLELPGSGGLIAHHVCSTLEGVYFQDVFTVACCDWKESFLAGLVALELGAGGTLPILEDPSLEQVRQRLPTPDFVLGLSKEKGGRFTEEQLRPWFPSPATTFVLL
ncbi:hypothetical protein SAMN05444354_13311 [Stigmatella aurantiaca]|uniref:Uncharacterized protein n=1 Tax=Stigmatella aurantiaca TaxID=41 RepID=A0A1H8EGG6_STIAU|nr:hypothetical protein [Stigmatella aurantiaca]SEN18480.1 hypothetical protein SAMN05444354_13311 [Stigmatella aurantiaca]